MIVEMIENMGMRPQVSGALLRMELEKLLRLFQVCILLHSYYQYYSKY